MAAAWQAWNTSVRDAVDAAVKQKCEGQNRQDEDEAGRSDSVIHCMAVQSAATLFVAAWVRKGVKTDTLQTPGKWILLCGEV